MTETAMRELKPLILILQFNEINLNINSLVHQYNLDTLESIDIKMYKTICKDLKIKCKEVTVKSKELKNISYPCIFIHDNDEIRIIINLQENNIIIKATTKTLCSREWEDLF